MRIIPVFAVLVFLAFTPPVRGAADRFTGLRQLAAPRLCASAQAYPGGGYEAANILVNAPAGTTVSEYASDSKGTETFIDFDLGEPVAVAAFLHIERADPATVASAELLFSDAASFQPVTARVPVAHANARAATTFATFAPVTARFVRWQVTAIHSYATVGGAHIAFFTPQAPEAAPSRTAIDVAGGSAVLKAAGGARLEPATVSIDYPYLEPSEAVFTLEGAEPRRLSLAPGTQSFSLTLPAVDRPAETRASLAFPCGFTIEKTVARRPVRPWVLYFLPHSHVDIGYTHVQTEVEKLQWQHLEDAIALARATASYPEGARFKWNCEVLWAVDSYLKHAAPEKRAALIDAVRKGWVHLDGLYGNQLTGLCRPEELFQLTACARRISRTYDIPIDAAMISDVPGYTWGLVPALAASGITYLSIGPNHCHRIGFTLAAWGDRAFYWQSPAGDAQVLCWMAGRAYSWFHPSRLGTIKTVKPEPFFEYLRQLEAADYPYDMVQIRYSIGGDNGPPDPDLPEFVRDWNAKYEAPRLVIATTRELLAAFEARYRERIPVVRGDFTPYWEDGAASTARETAMARTAAERLVQAQAIWALLKPHAYPAAEFEDAWREVLLFNEHTWGAHCSISQPDSDFTRSQWEIKRQFAVEAMRRADALLEGALGGGDAPGSVAAALHVFNTCSWPRTDLVTVPAHLRTAGDIVVDAAGRAVPSQRLTGGELVFLARDVPPLSASRYEVRQGRAAAAGRAVAGERTLATASLRVALDPRTGDLSSLTLDGVAHDFAAGGRGLNGFVYVAGRDPAAQQGPGTPRITITERGPLVAALLVESAAPGCVSLRREIRVIDGLDRVEITNTLDRKQVRTKEGLHFEYDFQVPDGAVRIDMPWAVVRPDLDQMFGACKNYLTVGRWVDLSNDALGITWASLDAPLIGLGAISVDVAEPLGLRGWLTHLPPTQRLFSYVMNNYWETNYKADQEGVTVFRYALMPHHAPDQVRAARFGVAQSQPLIAAPARGAAPPPRAPLAVKPAAVMVSSLVPSADGKALIARIFNTSDAAVEAEAAPAAGAVFISSPFEEQGAPIAGRIPMPPYGIVTLRIAQP